MERQKRLEEAKKQAEIHAQSIQKVLEDSEKIQEQKKGKILSKKAQAEERQRELDRLAEIEREKEREEERLLAERRRQVHCHY